MRLIRCLRDLRRIKPGHARAQFRMHGGRGDDAPGGKIGITFRYGVEPFGRNGAGYVVVVHVAMIAQRGRSQKRDLHAFRDSPGRA